MGLGSSVDFSRSVSLAGVSPQPPERRRTLLLSVKCELTLVWGARHLLANSHPQRWTLRDGKWRIAAAAATRGTTTARRPQTWPPRGGGKHPIPAPATASTPRAGLGLGGPTFTAPSPLAGGAPNSGLGIVEPRRGGRWGMVSCLIESVLGLLETVMGTPASNFGCPAISEFVYVPHSSCV